MWSRMTVFEELVTKVHALEERVTDLYRLLLDLREEIEHLKSRVNGRKDEEETT